MDHKIAETTKVFQPASVPNPKSLATQWFPCSFVPASGPLWQASEDLRIAMTREIAYAMPMSLRDKMPVNTLVYLKVVLPNHCTIALNKLMI